MKKLISAVCLFTLVLLSVVSGAGADGHIYAASATPKVEAEAAILMDMNTGTVLFEKNVDAQLYPASTTKMITCILAIENLDLDSEITVPREAANTRGNNINLMEGEVLSGRDLLYALMVESANDAAIALAVEVSGSVDAFCELMNDKAKELGASNTNFVNPNGLQDTSHLSTASDLAKIAMYCMRDATFREIVSTYHRHVDATNMQAERDLYNTNRMLFDTSDETRVYVNGILRHCKYDGTIGVKTGYTSHAQGCLVAAVTRENTTLLSVVLKSGDLGRFADTMAMMDWGFENFKTMNVMTQGAELGYVLIHRGAIKKVKAVLAESISISVPLEASNSILATEIFLDTRLTAPVEKGQPVGRVALYEGGVEVASYDAIAADSIAEGGILSVFGIEDATAALIGRIALAVSGILFLLLVIYIIIKRRQVKRRKALREAKRRKARELEARRRREWERRYEESIEERFRDY